MDIVGIIKEPALRLKSYPLSIIASSIRDMQLQKKQEVNASIKLIGLANALASENSLSAKRKILIQISEHLEVLADPGQSLYDIQKELSSLTGIQLI